MLLSKYAPADVGVTEAIAASLRLLPRLPLTHCFDDPYRISFDRAGRSMNSTMSRRRSPSSRVISVVAKGAKLRVMTRKKRWVQVTNPATSERGWIYAPKLATTP